MSSARRYFLRSPRYVLRPNDHQIMRVAPFRTKGLTYTTQLHDISETGLAFSLDGEDIPKLDEIIKVEFTVPGKKKIACFARVARLQKVEKWDSVKGECYTTKVAIEFNQLPDGHKAALQSGLKGKAKDGGDNVIPIHRLHEEPLRRLQEASMQVINEKLDDWHESIGATFSESMTKNPKVRLKSTIQYAILIVALIGALALLSIPFQSWLSAIKSIAGL